MGPLRSRKSLRFQAFADLDAGATFGSACGPQQKVESGVASVDITEGEGVNTRSFQDRWSIVGAPDHWRPTRHHEFQWGAPVPN